MKIDIAITKYGFICTIVVFCTGCPNKDKSTSKPKNTFIDACKKCNKKMKDTFCNSSGKLDAPNKPLDTNSSDETTQKSKPVTGQNLKKYKNQKDKQKKGNNKGDNIEEQKSIGNNGNEKINKTKDSNNVGTREELIKKQKSIENEIAKIKDSIEYSEKHPYRPFVGLVKRGFKSIKNRKKQLDEKMKELKAIKQEIKTV